MKNLSLLLGILTLMTPAVQATSFAERPFPTAVEDAPVIVRGKVGSGQADWAPAPDGSRRIYTFYEVQVEEVFKGTVNSRTITIREIGGRKDGIGLEIAGTASFAKGEDVVIFLNERNSDGHFDMRGMMMGKYNVQRDTEGTEVLVGPGISGTDEHGHGGGSASGDRRQKWTLDELRQLIASGPSSDSSSHPSAGNASTEPSARATDKPAASPSPKSSMAAVQEAPRLQPSPSNDSQATAGEPEEASGRSLFLYAIGGLLALGVLALILLRK